MSRWLLLVFASLCLFACEGDGTSPGDPSTDGADADGATDGSADGASDGSPAPGLTIDVSVSPDIICAESCYEVALGDSLQLFATVTDDTGAVVTLPVTFASADETLATVSADGLVTTRALGMVEIRASAGGATGSRTITIEPRPIARIEVEPSAVMIADVNGTAQLHATAYDDRDQRVPDAALSYVSANPLVATVSADGTITGTGQGSTAIWVGSGTAEGSASVVVKSVLPATPGLALAEITGGINFGCGATALGKAYCWGWNYWGQLGNGERGSELDAFPTPLAVAGDHAFHGLTGSESHTCALEPDGAAYCWGANGSGELGTADEEIGGITIPNPVDGGLVFRQISAGYDHTCGVASDSKVYCFGANFQGALGVGDYDDRRTPVAVASDLTFREVHAGLDSTCALATDGKAYCWGQNDFGQVGNGTDDTATSYETPQAVVGDHTFTQLDMRSSTACGVSTEGAIYCWGRNETAQLGDGSTSTGKSTPVKVVSDETFVQVAVGIWHVCGRTAAGDALCWGLNYNGQLGDGTTASSAAPVKVVGGLTFASVVGAGFHTCGLTTGGEAYCWGENNDGRLGGGEGFYGNGSLSPAPWPVASP